MTTIEIVKFFVLLMSERQLNYGPLSGMECLFPAGLPLLSTTLTLISRSALASLCPRGAPDVT